MKPELQSSYEDYYNRKVSYLDKLRDDHRLKCVLEEDEIDEYRDSVRDLLESWYSHIPEIMGWSKSQLFEECLDSCETLREKYELKGIDIDEDLRVYGVLKQSFNFYWDTYMGWYEEELGEEERGVINREREPFIL